MLGALISLVQLVRVSSRPHVALLGRIPRTRRFSDRDRHEDNQLIPNAMIFRPESVLIYFNIDNVCEAILTMSYEAGPAKAGSSRSLGCADCGHAEAPTRLPQWRTDPAMRIQFHAVEPRSSVRDRLRREGMTAKWAV